MKKEIFTIKLKASDLHLLLKALELARDKTRSDYDYDLYEEMLKNIKKQTKGGNE